ncbi:alpha/beta fold hydrolase [Sphingomonas solaris]|uniref:Alpha/beta hydrolase n=1 Tax=Alterirhizorhabdus solaris TaxID=2529389 RepID=A0A558R539_9SPHN|nr:alpha/beta hydrolase [Sphingomonas solaris]TVV74479.1 alpha/beta hydrolase [Sphingomonas solaris]
MKNETRLIETAPGIRLSVEVAGAIDAPLLILMHGWPELGHSWRHQVGPLARAGYRVAVPDMRGYGGSSKPDRIEAYTTDTMADDMAAIARALGAVRWAAVGHDWGAPVAWRCALRFPEQVAAIFSLSNTHGVVPRGDYASKADAVYPDRFFYVRYFQEIGPAEAELEADPRAALKQIFFALSGDAPQGEWTKIRPRDSLLLPGLIEPPAGPLSFMSEADLDFYAAHYGAGGFFGPLSWYRNNPTNARDALAYGDQRVTQPAGFLCGSKEILLTMVPDGLDQMRGACDRLLSETILPGAGHWIQQERPTEVTEALLGFLKAAAF